MSDYHQLSRSLDMFKLDMMIDDGFCRLNEDMILNDSLSVSSFAENGRKLK